MKPRCYRRFVARAASVALLCSVVAIGGCMSAGNEISSGYGQRRGEGHAASVNGVSALADMFVQHGAKVSSWKRLSPKLDECDTIVWAPDAFTAPQEAARSWLERWLLRGSDRTLVYIGRDFDGLADYWQRVQDSADLAATPEFARRLAEAKADYQRERAKLPAEEKANWFVLRGQEPPVEIESLSGPWSDGVDPQQADLRLSARLNMPDEDTTLTSPFYGPPNLEPLLVANDGEVLAFRIKHERWDGGQIIVVANGSFLLNLGLVNHEHRKLAGRLIEECYPARVVFLETKDNVEIRQKDPPPNSGFSVLTVWPLNIILVHAALLGIVYMFCRFPIFGRPRELPPERNADFGRHIDALAQLLAKTGNMAYAHGRLIHYQQVARRESGASHVKQSSAVASAPQPPPSARATP